MADVEISYNNSVIASLSAAGSEVLETNQTFLTDDITVTYAGGGGGISATTVHFSDSACPNAEYGGVIAYVDGTGTEQRTSALDPNYEGVDISMLSKSILVFFEQQNPMQTGAFNKDEITGMTQVKSSSIGSGAGKTWYKIFQVD